MGKDRVQWRIAFYMTLARFLGRIPVSIFPGMDPLTRHIPENLPWPLFLKEGDSSLCKGREGFSFLEQLEIVVDDESDIVDWIPASRFSPRLYIGITGSEPNPVKRSAFGTPL
jgi:hypothetical protein